MKELLSELLKALERITSPRGALPPRRRRLQTSAKRATPKATPAPKYYVHPIPREAEPESVTYSPANSPPQQPRCRVCRRDAGLFRDGHVPGCPNGTEDA